MSKLLWKTKHPAAPGWYWVQDDSQIRKVVEFVMRRGEVIANWSGRWVKFAGPIATPVEPSSEQQATVRYKLVVELLSGYFTESEWLIRPLLEVQQEAQRRLRGSKSYYNNAAPPDAKKIRILTSRKVNGRWGRPQSVDFHAETTADDFMP